MSFHIGNQQAGVINNVAGDQVVHGQRGHLAVGSAEALAAVEALRSVLTPELLPAGTARQEVDDALHEVERQARAPEPDRAAAAGALERLTRTLTAGGALAAAGVALAGPLQTLAAWLGPLAAPVLRLLAGG